MALIQADRIKETATTTGTGTFSLAGAVSGYRAFSAVMANNDVTYYCIEHQSENEWEVGYGTWQTGNSLARTTVLFSTNSDSAVSFSAGTKNVFITNPAIHAGWGLVTASPSSNQNDYSPTGLKYASNLSLTPSASCGITGLTGGYYGRRLTIHNDSTDYLIWLTNEDTASSAANRFVLPKGFPAFLMPGDHMILHYDAVAQRWEVEAWPNQGLAMGLAYFSDMGVAPGATSSTVGMFSITASGASAGSAESTYLMGTTEKPNGAIQLTTGTATTGRAHIGLLGTAQMVPTLGPALSVARLAIQTAVDGTNTYSVYAGFHDGSGGTPNDGVYWEYRWTGAAVEWSQTRMAAGSATRSNTSSPTADTNFIWVVVFMNANWTRADFIYSTDSISFTKSNSPTTGIPSSSQYTSWNVGITKSAGTTARIVSVDLAGFRYDYVRG